MSNIHCGKKDMKLVQGWAISGCFIISKDLMYITLIDISLHFINMNRILAILW